ncbi:hypothetical protein BHF71_03815 [Vulcanibacillus modesticaldus]|uniref:Uncharacterized protein n=1 Tax=Vulcanibacillus modesticaldus TaxID=337097 RepID=A0A1D2YSG6_9BACI|nr:hypothetical protein [Vulcanibacillus modesticaldus]OEF97271.1 hypothetical protein BHF71_03815 [Vulcanibacillus modesticaldus]
MFRNRRRKMGNIFFLGVFSGMVGTTYLLKWLLQSQNSGDQRRRESSPIEKMDQVEKEELFNTFLSENESEELHTQ